MFKQLSLFAKKPPALSASDIEQAIRVARSITDIDTKRSVLGTLLTVEKDRASFFDKLSFSFRTAYNSLDAFPSDEQVERDWQKLMADDNPFLAPEGTIGLDLQQVAAEAVLMATTQESLTKAAR